MADFGTRKPSFNTRREKTAAGVGRRETMLSHEVIVNNNPRAVVCTKNGSWAQVVIYALMRVMRRGIGNAVDEPVWSEDHCGARLPGVLRAVMRNLDRTDVCPASKPKVRLHLSKGCTVDA